LQRGVFTNELFGVLVSNLKLYAANLIYVGVMEKRLPAWQGLHLSSGGKSILMESSLSSLPMYTMGIYLLPEKVHHKIDSARARFYWDSG
jgi:hypothetical protein